METRPYPPAGTSPIVTEIPFGFPPLPRTTHIADTHHPNEKARPYPAKRNLGLARAGFF